MNRRVAMLTGGAALAAAGGAGRAAGVEDLAAAAFRARQKRLRIGDDEIAYLDEGAGDAALFIHGWPLNGYQWRGAIARLSPGWRCLAPDLLGLGYTEAAAQSALSPAAQAAMLWRFADAVGAGPLHIVASDSGVGVAQLMACARPAGVRSLLLTNGDVHEAAPPEALQPALDAAAAGELWRMIQAHFDDPGFAASPQGLGGICYENSASLTPEAMRIYFTPLLASPRRMAQFQAYGVAFRPNPLPALRPRLARLPVPARMVWGDADIHFPVALAYWLDRTLPMSRGVRVVAGAKLFFPEEQPALVAAEAERLWRGSKG